MDQAISGRKWWSETVEPIQHDIDLLMVYDTTITE
jgi:hypothetical protein